MIEPELITKSKIQTPYKHLRFSIGLFSFITFPLILYQLFYNYLHKSSFIIDLFMELSISAIFVFLTIIFIQKIGSYSGVPSTYLLYQFPDTMLYLFFILPIFISNILSAEYDLIFTISCFLAILEFHFLLYKRDNKISVSTFNTGGEVVFQYYHRIPLVSPESYSVKEVRYVIVRQETLITKKFSISEIFKPVSQIDGNDDQLYSLCADIGICDNDNIHYLILVAYKRSWSEIQDIITTISTKLNVKKLDIQNILFHNGSGLLRYSKEEQKA